MPGTAINAFLMLWAVDFASNRVSESSEYFVYWGLFETKSWSERCAQSAKGAFLVVPKIKKAPIRR